MPRNSPMFRWPAAALIALAALTCAPAAHAQGFISPSYGYNFGGDAGCRTATDCRDKNWNWGGALGILGSVVGFEAELNYEGEFTGDRPVSTSVTTLMGNFLLAPRITILQPYGLVGVGGIRTKTRDGVTDLSSSETSIGWTIGGGLIVYVQEHIGLKADIRYYHSFEVVDLLNFEVDRGNKIDFGRAGFGVVFRF